MAKGTKNYFIKTYYKSNLLSAWSIVKERIRLIEILSAQLKHLPETKFKITEHKIEYIQKFKKRKAFEYLNLGQKKKLLFDLAQSLDKMNQMGFVHGDLNRKNIIYSEEQLWIIDLEPDLNQIKKGKEALMITRPYYSKEDIENRIITFRTDKIAWYVFIKKMANDCFYKDNDEIHSEIKLLTDINDFYKMEFSMIIELLYNE